MLVTRPFTNAELRKLLEDLAARHFAPGDSSVDRGLIAEAARRLTEAGWLPIATAPRDGKNLLLRFGEDGVSQGKYIPGLPNPWLFIDTNDGITWLLNHAVDGPGGPSHWQAFPSDRETLAADVANQAAEPLVRFCPGCGSVGEIGDGYRDCCPDGNEARMIPEKLAGKCQDLFQTALRGVLAQRGLLNPEA